MATQDAGGPGARHLARLDIRHGGDLQRGGVGNAGIARPPGQAQHQHQSGEARPDHRDRHDREQDGGDGQHHVHQPQDQRGRPAADPPGGEPERDADRERDRDREDGHGEGRAGAEQDARQQVPPKVVRAQREPPLARVRRARRPQPQQQRLAQRVVRSDPGSGEGGQCEKKQDGG